jgi:uncharacterized protein
MKAKLVNESPRTHVLIFDTGEEVVSGITKFATQHKVNAASLTAIGAFSSAVVGYFSFDTSDYKKIPVEEQVEVLSLIGDIVQYQDKPMLHAHVIVGKSDGTAHGGHLLQAYVKPTLEVILTELPAHLHREMNREIGIPLIKI